VATPQGYEPDAQVLARAKKMGARVTCLNDPLAAARGAQVLNTDVWASMGQEEEQAKRARAFADFQINESVIAAADPECIILHCLPAHRGEEITDAAIESRHSVVFDEAENRLHIQKAIMATLMA
jgi:ornithine carbamoyltransferase